MPATYEPIATTTLGSAAASITFSAIPSTYTDLRLVLNYLCDGGVPQMYCNGVTTGTLWSSTRLRGNGSTASSDRDTSIDLLDFYESGSNSSTRVRFWSIDFFSYAGSTNKTMLISQSQDNNGSGDTFSNVALYRSTSAISSITFTLANYGANFTTGTTATLYGIKNA
jgi:hypothetical protein